MAGPFVFLVLLLPDGTVGTNVRVVPPNWPGEDAALAGGTVSFGDSVWAYVGRCSTNMRPELRSLEELPSSKRDEAVQERREWLLRLVADLRDGAMTPTVLVAIQKRGRNRDRQT
jgi:hypothetical protein